MNCNSIISCRRGPFAAIAVMLALCLFVAPAALQAQEAPAAAPAATQPAAPTHSFLDEDTPTTAATADETAMPKIGTVIGKLVGVMVFLFVLLAAGLYGFQKISRRGLSLGGGNDKRPLKVMDKVSLGPKHGVVLLKACDRLLVVGISDKEMSVLTEVSEESDKSFAALINQPAQAAGVEK